MTEFWELNRPKRKPMTTGWLVAACVVVALWSLIAVIVKLGDPATGIAGALAGKAMTPRALGFAIGSAITAALIPVVVVWLLLYFVVVRRNAPERGGPHFGILLGVTVVASLAAAGLFVTSERVAAEQAQAGIADKEIAAAMVQALEPGETVAVDSKVKATGEAGEIERLIKQMIIALQTDRQHYIDELKGLGFPNYLSGKWLAADRSLTKSRAGLAQAGKIVAKYRAMNLQRIDEFKARVNASTILTASHKRQLLEGVDRGLSESRERGERIWELDAAMVAEIQSAIDDLARARGRWSTSGEKVVFYRQSDLDAFNQHVYRLQAIGQESDQIKRGMQTTIKTRSPS